MKLIVNLEGTDNFQECEITPESTVYELKLMLTTLFNFPYNEMELYLNSNLINNQQLIKNLGIDNDVLILKRRAVQNQLGDIFSQFMNSNRNNMANSSSYNNQGMFGSTPVNQNRNYNFLDALLGSFRSNSKEQFIKKRVKELKERFLTSSEDLDALFKNKPDLAEAIVSGNDAKVEAVVRKQVEKAEKKEKDKEMEYIKLMNSDQNDPEVQRKIQQIINQKNIDENLRQAEEYMPETLFPVHMLYINLEINKKKVVALVDTGAQSTVMSQHLCKKCNLFNLCDTRFSGIAKGVGVSRIIGTVHAAEIKIDGKFLMGKITVVENKSIGFIFGLDNMRAHRCLIDLSKNGLVFQDIGVTAKFLSDGEIKEIRSQEDYDDEESEKGLVDSGMLNLTESEMIEQAKKNSLDQK